MAVSPDAANIATGAGWLWQAPLGTAEPINLVVAWPAGWTQIGYTAEGHQEAIGLTVANVEVAESSDPLKRVTTARDVRVSFAMAEVTLSKLKLALNGGTTIVLPSVAVTNKALTTNVATLTTASAHGFIAGDVVTVVGVDSIFDGTYTLTAGSGTTFSYAKTNANIASVAATGGASIPTTTLGSALEPPDVGGEVRTMLGWQSEDAQERIVWRKCLQAGTVTTPRRKGADYARFPAEFALETPAGVGVKPFKHMFATARVA